MFPAMRRLVMFVLVASLAAACQRAKDSSNQSGSGSSSPSAKGSGGSAGVSLPQGEQVTPPLDLKNPPADATKTPSGLIYKKLVTVAESNPAPKRNDIVVINFSSWQQSTGKTLRARGQPMPLNLATAAPAFVEAMQVIRKGEKAMLWVPPSIGQKQGSPNPAPQETLVYEIEVVDIQPAPEIPADLKPPATAQSLKSGTQYVVIRPGTGPDKPRSFDTVTFTYTAWDSEGRLVDSTELRKRPMTTQPFRVTPVKEELLLTMAVGARVRFWADAEKMMAGGRPIPGAPKGLLTYELELASIGKASTPPPAVPADVAKPSADAKKTEKGVFYKVLKPGKGGPKPKPTDSVRVHYTGWTTDGRMFDSSVIRNEPAEFSLGGVIAGWTDGIPVMSVGDRVLFWIPEELAYKGQPGRPQGMLVFDVELLEIKAASDPHGHGQPAAGDLPAPPDVAAPPKDAKKTAKGVSYKVLASGKGGPKPTAADTVRVHYSGWTTDGKMFDSSVKRGQPAEFPLGGVIAGWTDGLQVMSVGDKVRFWIPEELAYKGQPGRPQGMLVFDVELLAIIPSH